MFGSFSGKGKTALVTGTVGAAMVMSLATTGAFAAPTPQPTTKTASCAPQDGVTANSVKFALLTSATGANASNFAGFIQAAKLRIAQENAKGGVFGRKITTVELDDQSSGSTQSLMANKAVQDEKAFGVIQITTQDTMMPIFKAVGMPVIGINNGPSGSTDRNAFIATGPASNLYTTNAGAIRMAQTGAKKMATIAFPVPAAQAAANSWAASLPSQGLTEVLRIGDAPFGAYDATSTALRIKSSGAEGVYLILLVDGGVSVMNALKQQGVTLKAPYMAGLSDPAVIAKAGTALDGVIGSTYGTVPGGVPGRPGVRTYINGMKAVGANPYGPSAPLGYVSADTFIKGLKLAGTCPTRAGLINALHNVKSIDGAGLLPEPINYRPGLTPNGNPPTCSWFIVAQGGQMIPDKKATCGQLMEVATGKIVS
ncbi:MAG: ABC transporter substrate-binding protein [Candidatus Nanopelagicales bacterium]